MPRDADRDTPPSLICLASFGIGEIGEPFEFGGKLGGVAELGGDERVPERDRARAGDSNQIFFHAAAGQCSLAALPEFLNMIREFISQKTQPKERGETGRSCNADETNLNALCLGL
ncbi:MAG: hypothetical protein JO189_07640 [Deltaproteobacteria bacterium]|nr:hypothetical protein [Deltaproteobacteria bacterium]